MDITTHIINQEGLELNTTQLFVKWTGALYWPNRALLLRFSTCLCSSGL